jgi:hypothetical protein
MLIDTAVMSPSRGRARTSWKTASRSQPIHDMDMGP